jgi:hypothetical protein
MPSPRLRYTLLVALLLAGYFFMAVGASRTKSNTFDESVHITAGYNAWTLKDHRFDPGNGDFVKRWAALPLLFSKPNLPSLEGDDWRSGQFVFFSRDFLYNAGNDPARILAQTRPMVTLLGVLLGIVVFAWSRSLFGTPGGLISATVFAFCPTMLAHGALVTTDVALTLMLFTSTWFLWRLLHLVSWFNLLASLLAFSLLVVSKMSSVLIAPIAAILLIARCFNREPWQWQLGAARTLTTRGRQSFALLVLIVAHCVAGWVTIWAMFDFKYAARGDTSNTELVLMRPSENIAERGVIGQLVQFCYETHVLPEGFVYGMAELVGISQRRPSFMDGHWKAGGQTWFFPYALWVKTPPALFILILSGAAGGWWMRRTRKPPDAVKPATPVKSPGTLYHAIPLAALFIVYAAVAMRQGVNIGHRHILPLYPVLYVLAGSAALWLPVRNRIPHAVLGVLLAWYAFDSLSARPHYLAFISRVAGGPDQGYQRLADSSLDWGQDLPALKTWLDANNPDGREPVFFSYFGTGLPEHYGIASKRLPGFPEWRNLSVFALTPGYYAISATMFQNLYTPHFGPWNRVYEENYQQSVQSLGLTEAASRDTDSLVDALLRHPDVVWQEHYSGWEKLRFNRLCGWLRATRRAPDAQVGHSILIWKLDQQDLRQALWEPARELFEAPATLLPDGISSALP